jgi:hypothetical protein
LSFLSHGVNFALREQSNCTRLRFQIQIKKLGECSSSSSSCGERKVYTLHPLLAHNLFLLLMLMLLFRLLPPLLVVQHALIQMLFSAERRAKFACARRKISIFKRRSASERKEARHLLLHECLFMKAERQSEPTTRVKVNAIPLRTCRMREREREMLITRVVIMSENKCSVVMMGLSQHACDRMHLLPVTSDLL